MSIWSRLRATLRRGTNTNASVAYVNGWGGDWRARLHGMSIPTLYATQPHLQSVITFRARNVAQLPLQVFDTTDGLHERDRTSTVAQLLEAPNPHQTTFELIRDTVTSIDLYGEAYWLCAPSLETPHGWQLENLPPAWITSKQGGDAFQPAYYTVSPPIGDGTSTRIPARNVIRFSNFETSLGTPISPVQALKNILEEQIASWEYRQQIWNRGGRVGTYLHRPANAPAWSAEAYDRFTEAWHEFQRGGARAGETPLLEDGMELRRIGFSAREDEWAEASRLSLQTVCAVYHVAPAMLGLDGTSTYASVREFRSMLYTETLGPIIRQLEQRIDRFIVPLVEPNYSGKLQAKFNIDAKLAGSFEEQASVLSTATGAPWLAVNEARALRNLPPLPGADQLVVPLNVTQGGQASPQSGQAPSVAVENARTALAAVTSEPDEDGEAVAQEQVA